MTLVPIPIMIRPLKVHSGFAYMNEEEGPTNEELCK
jgi:hypothetical protein